MAKTTATATAARMRRALLLALLSLSCPPLLAGCWDRTEINDVAIVLGTAIDLAPNGQVRTTVQYALPGQLGGPGGGGGGTAGKKPYAINSAVGHSIRECDSLMQKHMSRELFFAHRRVLIVSEEFARKKGILGLLDFIGRQPENRLSMYLIVAKGNAYDLLTASPKLERYPAEAVREEVISRSMTRLQIKKVAQAISGEASQPVTPYLGLHKIEVDPEKSEDIAILGYAQFKGGKMIGSFTGDAMPGLNWLLRSFRPYVLNVKSAAGDDVTMLVSNGRSRMSVRLEQGRPRFTLEIWADTYVGEDQSEEDLTVPANYQYMERAISEQIEQSVKDAVAQIKRMRSDSAGIGMVLYRAYPREWKARFEKRWKDMLPEIPIEIRVQTRIKEIGLTSDNISSGRDAP